jgi:ATP-dependent Clp protease ATP-binding subunit ClpA
MTQNRQSKRATRSRMAQTGEQYTEARRALLASGGDSGRAGGDPGVTIAWPEDSLGWFTDQAYNLILVAEDEARMMSHATVEPEHLLLATTRRGNVQRLLAGLDHAIHDLILRIRGFGEKLELRPRRSPASEAALRRAVLVAADRGVLGPSTEYLLLAVGEQELPARILGELGITDVQALVDAKYPVTRPPIDPAIVQVRAAQLAARGQTAPSPGPIPPIFERFTSQARDAVNAGIEHARKLDAPYVEPAHLLYGVLDARTGVVATVRARHSWDLPPAQIAQPSYSRATDHSWDLPPAQIAQPSYSRATDIFSDDARRIVAEDVLIIAERLGQSSLTTGHLLVAILESPDEHTGEITRLLPDGREITAAVIDALPGQEEP